MESFNLSQILSRPETFEEGYFQFIKKPSLRAGVYVLEAGATDPQTPHKEDELYYVIEGEAVLRTREKSGAEEKVNIGEGSILFVRAGMEHAFCDIKKTLKLLVFFSALKPA